MFSAGSAGADTSGRGETFNDYLRRVIFPKEQYELRRVVFQSEAFDPAAYLGDAVATDEEHIDQNLPPVYTFRCNKTGQEF